MLRLLKLNNTFEDIQNWPDNRNISVDRVGIRGIKHPVRFEDWAEQGNIASQHLTATIDMMVNLPKDVKGTHMSRFVEILNAQEVVLSVANMPYWLDAMATKLEAQHCFFKANFDYFLTKTAPISKVKSLMDYQITLNGVLYEGVPQSIVTVVIPVTSLCPCSKELSKYGAHNQRSHITLTLEARPNLSLQKIIQLVESNASCELYGIVKRNDEKYITEKAYENPKFVEDMVRDVAHALSKEDSLLGYKVASENFESIHNHSAYAEIDCLTLPAMIRAL